MNRGEAVEELEDTIEDNSVEETSEDEDDNQDFSGDQAGIDALIAKMHSGDLDQDSTDNEESVTIDSVTEEIEDDDAIDLDLDFTGDQAGIDALVTELGKNINFVETDVEISVDESDETALIADSEEIDGTAEFEAGDDQFGIDQLLSEINDGGHESAVKTSIVDFQAAESSEDESSEITDIGIPPSKPEESEPEEKDDSDFAFHEDFDEIEESPDLPKASDSDVEELLSVVKEIAGTTDDTKKEPKKPTKSKIYTTTIADLYAKQGKYSEALEIYNSFPPDERLKHSEKIQQLESKIQDMEE